MTNRRLSRVNELIREELSELLRTEVRDSRIAPVTSLTQVEITPDLHLARIFVSVLGDAYAKAATIEGLQAAAGFLQRELKRRITLKHIPTLTFVLDDSIESGARLSALIDEIGRQQKQRPKRR